MINSACYQTEMEEVAEPFDIFHLSNNNATINVWFHLRPPLAQQQTKHRHHRDAAYNSWHMSESSPRATYRGHTHTHTHTHTQLCAVPNLMLSQCSEAVKSSLTSTADDLFVCPCVWAWTYRRPGWRWRSWWRCGASWSGRWRRWPENYPEPPARWWCCRPGSTPPADINRHTEGWTSDDSWSLYLRQATNWDMTFLIPCFILLVWTTV